ncbi:MAG: glycosyltransferase family 4 protein [Candidatus Omnitrophica bacterium]|nr:glycosyltransferase family 4 protein [Candidatus Omnitrophota bacterium]
MTKVAHFISASGLYGAERWVLGLLNNLKKIDAVLICSNHDSPSLLKEAKKLGIATKLLKVRGNYSFLDFISKLAKLLKEEKVDVLHTHGYKSDILGYFAARKAGIKIISTLHGWSQNAGLKVRLYESLDRIFLRYFDLIVPLSDGLRKSLRYVRKDKIKIINNFVDLSSIPEPEKGDPKLITFIGQLIERKRVQDLIISLNYISDKNVKLQIIGDGPKKKELMDLTKKLNLQDKITFYGFRKDRLQLLNKSGIFVLPSLLEGIPRAMMEAMAMEKIVIGTDISGIRELIKHKEKGLLVPTKNPKKLAEAIEWVLDHQNETEKIRKNAKILIKKEFSAERAAKEYEELYIKRLSPCK